MSVLVPTQKIVYLGVEINYHKTDRKDMTYQETVLGSFLLNFTKHNKIRSNNTHILICFIQLFKLCQNKSTHKQEPHLVCL